MRVSMRFAYVTPIPIHKQEAPKCTKYTYISLFVYPQKTHILVRLVLATNTHDNTRLAQLFSTDKCRCLCAAAFALKAVWGW